MARNIHFVYGAIIAILLACRLLSLDSTPTNTNGKIRDTGSLRAPSISKNTRDLKSGAAGNSVQARQAIKTVIEQSSASTEEYPHVRKVPVRRLAIRAIDAPGRYASFLTRDLELRDRVASTLGLDQKQTEAINRLLATAAQRLAAIEEQTALSSEGERGGAILFIPAFGAKGEAIKKELHEQLSAHAGIAIADLILVVTSDQVFGSFGARDRAIEFKQASSSGALYSIHENVLDADGAMIRESRHSMAIGAIRKRYVGLFVASPAVDAD